VAIECPHCFTYVHVQADGQCPSCREDTNDLREVDRDLTTIVICENSPLPDVCCGCGLPARRSIRIKRWKPLAGERSVITDDAETGVLLLALQIIFSWVGALFLQALRKSSSHDRQTVSVPIVQCETCSMDGPPRPLRVDYEYFTMRFVVHRTFVSRFEELAQEQESR
jgi:hypothetical protein